MTVAARPHLLGIDDGPFEKDDGATTPLVAVMMEGADLIEGVALSTFPVDGAGVTEHLGDWIAGLRHYDALQGVVLGGITIAGLAVVDIRALFARLAVPILSVTRRDPAGSRVEEALQAAGLEDRIAILEHSPPAVRFGEGLWLASAGIADADAARLAAASIRKSLLPEPLRIAHLFASALVRGESRGRA